MLAAVLCAAPVAAAGILLGVFWGTVAATLGSIAVTTAVLYIAPRVKRATLLGRALAWLRRWAIERATHPGRAVRWAYHVGGTAGFIVSSILLGPTVTSLMIALVRGSRRRLWPVVVGSSLVFSGFAVNLFAGLWALFRR
ncbi:MAG: hypothetical protein FJZ97_13455 [Chloroflexi bacterium]|nr:hypothetical protein [Chloroflexota bacterium]